MLKQLKRIGKVFLILLLVVSYLPAKALAATSQGFHYKIPAYVKWVAVNSQYVGPGYHYYYADPNLNKLVETDNVEAIPSYANWVVFATSPSEVFRYSTGLSVERASLSEVPLDAKWLTEDEYIDMEQFLYSYNNQVLQANSLNEIPLTAKWVTYFTPYNYNYIDIEEPTILSQPEDKSLAIGSEWSLSVDAYVDSGQLSYQWYRLEGGQNQLIAGATGDTLMVPTSQAGVTEYYCVITNLLNNNQISIDSNTAQVTVIPNSSNANLSELQVNGFQLNEPFTPQQTNYTVTVPRGTPYVWINVVTQDPQATVQVNGGVPVLLPVPLNPEGTTDIPIVVTAANGDKKTYTVHVNKQASNNANLQNLTLSAGTLQPTFSAETAAYQATVGNNVHSISMTLQAEDLSAQTLINGQPVTGPLPLEVGENRFEVQVTAQDGVARKTYTVVISRLAAAPNVQADDEQNRIIGLTEQMEYKVNDGNWTLFNPDSLLDLSGNKSVAIRFASNSVSAFPSEETVLIFTKNLGQPVVTNATTVEDTKTDSGLIIVPQSDDLTVSHFKISGITGGTLYKNDGAFSIQDGDMITMAEGGAGLKFKPFDNANTPSGDTFSFRVQSAKNAQGAGISEEATAVITVHEVNDEPVAVADNLGQLEMNKNGIDIAYEDLLANDSAGPSNEQNQTLVITAVEDATGGTVELKDGKVVFMPSQLGEVSFSYTITDNGTSENQADPRISVATVSFTVIDTEEPTLTLAGEETIYVQQGELYQEPGYSAIDNVDGDLTDRVTVVGTVESDQLGTYLLKYSVEDSSGNKAKQMERTVKVVSAKLQELTTSIRDINLTDERTYELTVPADVDTISVDAVALDESATIVINGMLIGNDGNLDVTLREGENLITIMSTSLGGFVETYTLLVNREYAPPAAPQVTGDDTKNIVVGMDESMEFSIDNGETWKSYQAAASPTFSGKVTVLIRIKASGQVPAGQITTVQFTVNPLPPATNDGGSKPKPEPQEPEKETEPEEEPTKPTTEQIVVDVDGKDGTLLAKTPITRTTETDGKVKDKVTMTNAIAKETVEKAKENGTDTARIVIPDKEDKVSEIKVDIPKSALTQLAEGNVKLEIETANGLISIPVQSILDFQDDLYFRIVPIKSKEAQLQVEERAKAEQVIQDAIGDEAVQVLGRPMEIETNMQSREVTITLPIEESLPKDAAKRKEIVDHLGIFIEHSDSTKELIPGKLVTLPDGTAGIEFTVTKFSTFTMVYLEGWKDAQEESAQSVTHKPYIFGDAGKFHPNANVTRAQMAAMMARNLDNSVQAVKNPYQDVNRNHWAYDNIMQMKNEGLMLGVTKTEFNPQGDITRGQMALIAYRWIQQECVKDPSAFAYCSEQNIKDRTDYKDVSPKHQAYEAIAVLQANQIMSGFEDGTFRPGEKLKRGQAVKVINRLFKRGPLTGVTEQLFKDVPSSHWAFEEIAEAAMEHTAIKTEEGTESIQR